MEFSYQDKGNYFRGLLILIGKDNAVDEKERERVINLGKKIGFEPKFCSDSVNNLLENIFINPEPPKFSSIEVIEKFFDDAFQLAMVDKDIQKVEIDWLRKIAEVNNLTEIWLENKLKYIKLKSHKFQAITTT